MSRPPPFRRVVPQSVCEDEYSRAPAANKNASDAITTQDFHVATTQAPLADHPVFGPALDGGGEVSAYVVSIHTPKDLNGWESHPSASSSDVFNDVPLLSPS